LAHDLMGRPEWDALADQRIGDGGGGDGPFARSRPHPATWSDSESSAMRTLARRMNLPRRCATGVASSRGNAARNSSGAVRTTPSSAITRGDNDMRMLSMV
jgi:hypothetical protein